MNTASSHLEDSDISAALNAARFSPFHLKAMWASSMGFFTSAYDLFIIGTALVLIKDQWHLSADEVGLVGSISLIATFVGAYFFGFMADKFGRKKIYGLEAILMTIGALLSAVAPNVSILIVARVILGLGIGGDYPMSAVLMSEYANSKSRGRMVSLVFSAQAIGLVMGPVVALTLLAAGMNHDLAWRLMLGLGALPAMAVIYIRRTLPESPRWLARVKGDSQGAARELASFSLGTAVATKPESKIVKQPLSKYWLTLLGTAGSWFVFDYAYYGNTISTPMVMQHLAPHSDVIQSTALSLIVFAVAAVPGYFLAAFTIDRVGHKTLQMLGFAMMGLMFLLIGAFPMITASIGVFLVIYGLSYFFAEYGPNTTTFVIAGEVYPVNLRTTGHGISAGTAKVGAFLGAFIFPVLLHDFGLHGTLMITFFFALAGLLLTLFFVPEASGKTLEEVSGEDKVTAMPHGSAPAHS
ncbi:MAG: MFS transporter [Acidithiobacillus sp.]|nr:MFS transporter [Acidithiobacillus sp.]